MRIAVAGSGSLARHLVDELPRAGHEVVLLTRSHKPFFDGKRGLLEQRVADFASVDGLAEQLADCDALVSTIVDYTRGHVDVHLALIEACKRTPKCKRFIPSEFGGNTEDFPEEPGSNHATSLDVKNALRAQSELEWTVVSVGWLADYVVPAAQRVHTDLGPLHALDHNAKTLTIPGTGHEPFATTSARDVAAAVAQLLKSKTAWRPFTYVQAEETTWHALGEVVRTVGGLGDELKITHESVAELEAVLANKDTSPEQFFVAEFKLYVPLGKLKFDQAKVARDRADYFPTVHFRSLAELVQAAKTHPTELI